MRSHSLLWWGLAALGTGALLTAVFMVIAQASRNLGDNPIGLTGPLLVLIGVVLLVVGAVMRAVRR